MDVMFPLTKMSALSKTKMSLLFFVKRKGNLYKIRLGELSNQNVSCLLPVKENHWV